MKVFNRIGRAIAALAVVAAFGACGDDTDTEAETPADATTATTVATPAAVATTVTSAAGATTTTTVSVTAEPGGEPVSKTGTLTGDERDAYSIDVAGGAGERIYATVKGSKGETLLLALYDPANKKVADGASELDHQADDSGKYLITVRTASPGAQSTKYTIEIGVSVPAT